MKRNDFHIGLEFWCGGKRWRCTDVGSRVVVAISLEPHEVVSVAVDPNDRSKRTEQRSMTDDPSWLHGPPYAVVEHVFDEDSVEACTLERDEGSRIEPGLAEREQEKKRFFELADRLADARDPEEQSRLKEELAGLIFGE